MKAIEHPPNVWVVVDANHHLPFAATRESGHALIVFKRKIHAIAGRLPVRRIHVVEGMDMYARMKLGMTNPALIEQSAPPMRPVWTPDFSRVN